MELYKNLFGNGTCVLVDVLGRTSPDNVFRDHVCRKLTPLHLEIDFTKMKVLKYASTGQARQHIVYEVSAPKKEDGTRTVGLVSLHECLNHSEEGWKVNAHTNFVSVPFGFIPRQSIYPATHLFTDRDVEPLCGC